MNFIIKMWTAGWVVASNYNLSKCELNNRVLTDPVHVPSDGTGSYGHVSTQQCELVLNNGTRLSAEPQYFVPSGNTVYLSG